MEGYVFRTFYTSYDQYKYGLSNPACLEVYRNDELLFKENFKAYDELSLVSKGYHNLGGKKLIFTLEYGTEANDYIRASRYYAISDNHTVVFLRQLWSSSSDYANRYFEHVFPEDTSGFPDRLMIVEGLSFKEKDLPNRYDTTHIDFSKSGFAVKKLSNRLEKK